MIFSRTLIAGFLTLFLCASPVLAQSGKGVQEFVPSQSLLKLEEGMKLLRGATDISAVAPQVETLLKESIADDKTQVRAYYNLAVLYMRVNRAADATALLEQATKEVPTYGEGYALLARLKSTDSPQEAAALFSKALDADPMSAIANNKNATQALNKKDWGAAILNSRKALVGNPESVNAYLNMATSYFRQGQHDLAFLVCQSGLRIAPKSAALKNLEGLVLLQQDKVKDALASFRQAVAADPTFLDAQLNAGALTLNYNDYTSALGYFEAVLRQEAGHKMARLSKGVALRGLERYDEARALFEEMVRENPQDKEPHYNLCILLHEHMANYEKALPACTAFAKLLPEGHEKAAEMESRVQGIEDTIAVLKE